MIPKILLRMVGQRDLWRRRKLSSREAEDRKPKLHLQQPSSDELRGLAKHRNGSPWVFGKIFKLQDQSALKHSYLAI